MAFALLIALCTCAAALLWARLHGYVYVGRTAAGWTTVHDDTHAIGERIRVLHVAGTYQSATFLDERWADPVFPYHALFDHAFDAWPTAEGPKSIVVLGGGGYAVPKHLVMHHPELDLIEVVEIDPAIERIARRHFFLDRLAEAERTGRLRLHVGEARAWLKRADRRYDIIVNDCFFGLEPEGRLMSASAARLVHQRLTQSGRYLTNVVSALEGPDARTLYGVIEALQGAFAHVWVYPCGADDPTSPENNVVIASDAWHAFEGAWEWPSPQEERP